MISEIFFFHQIVAETATRGALSENAFLKILQNSQKNTSVGFSFLKNYRLQACSFFKKETPARVFLCEFC